MVAGQFLGHDTGDLVHRSLGRGIAVGPVAQRRIAHNRPHVDHTRRIVGVGRGDQHRQQGLRQAEHARVVDIHHLGPGIKGKLSHWRAPADARVVHQDVQGVGAFLYGLGQCCDPFLGADIACETLDTAGGVHLVQFLRNGKTGIGLARGDQHMCACPHQSGGCHTANAGGTPGHQRDLTFQ